MMSDLSALSIQHIYNLLQPVTLSPSSPRSRFLNWGRSYSCKPLAVFEPENLRDCQLILELARREGQTVRAVGVGHSPSDLGCTTGYMIRTDRLNKIKEVRRLRALRRVHAIWTGVAETILLTLKQI